MSRNVLAMHAARHAKPREFGGRGKSLELGDKLRTEFDIAVDGYLSTTPGSPEALSWLRHILAMDPHRI